MHLSFRLTLGGVAIFCSWPLSLFASETLVGPVNYNLTASSPSSETREVSTEQFDNLVLTFNFDSRELDGPAGGSDYFVYGWRSGGIDNELGRINGLPGNGDPAEQGSVNIVLPAAAQVPDLTIYFRLTADSAGDVVRLTNTELAGVRRIVPATGSITWTKQVTGTTSSDWGFTFFVSGEVREYRLTPTQATATATSLAPGTYRLSELVPSDWTLSSIDCSSGVVDIDLVTGLVTINLLPSTDVYCVFVNNWEPPTVVLPPAIPADLCVKTSTEEPVPGVRVELTSESGVVLGGETSAAGCFRTVFDMAVGPWVVSFLANPNYQFLVATSTLAVVEIVSNSELGRWPLSCRLPVSPMATGSMSSTGFDCLAFVTPVTVLSSISSPRSGRSGGGSRRLLSLDAAVADSVPAPEPLVLGEQVTVVPRGGVAAGVRQPDWPLTVMMGLGILGLMAVWRLRRRGR